MIEGQPESIVKDIENMVRLYVEKVDQTYFEQFIDKIYHFEH